MHGDWRRRRHILPVSLPEQNLADRTYAYRAKRRSGSVAFCRGVLLEVLGGLFLAYRNVARRADLDAVVHLGDYIYEDAATFDMRPHDPPRETVTLGDYRARYAQYRTDPHLQEAHRQHPFICVWDDHETANNSWRDGASNHDPITEDDWAQRKAVAQRAYSEWIPIRVDSPDRIFRKLPFGDLLDLVMLDTRLWGRDQQVPPGDVEAIHDPDRSLLGFDQEDWLARQLTESTAQWKIIGQQVMLTQWKSSPEQNSEGGGSVLNSDAWDGYEPPDAASSSSCASGRSTTLSSSPETFTARGRRS